MSHQGAWRWTLAKIKAERDAGRIAEVGSLSEMVHCLLAEIEGTPQEPFVPSDAWERARGCAPFLDNWNRAGKLTHYGDCDLYRAAVHVCTCGLLKTLQPHTGFQFLRDGYDDEAVMQMESLGRLEEATREEDKQLADDVRGGLDDG